jgi:glucose-1-phosphate cytidylyltransferase
MFENDPIDNAIYDKNLAAFRHNDFWQCVDTKRDYKNLLKLCKNKKKAPWLDLK